MDQEFKTAYGQLNTAQRQAVDAIEGPVLVVAGPGTGKTQLLSLRVANILQKTDTDPSGILCLTFTNFATTNMRQRLNNLVGSSAHNVMVRTFHSFAAEIMSLYPDYFWNGARLSIAPDTVQLEIVQNILASLPLDNPLASRFAGNYTMLSDVQQALKLTKEAGLTPDKLAAMLDINQAYLDVIEPQLVDILAPTLSVKKLPVLQAAIAALPSQAIDETVTPLVSLSTVLKDSLTAAVTADEASGKTTQTGRWKRRWLQTVDGQKGLFDERRRNAWWQAIVEVYELYRQQLHARGYYDYSDMIIEVITQLEQQAELRASVQERFLYVLIDEFQDTNAAQLRLAHLVATHASNEGRPNIMAVGDDDQSIFAFNGAELNNMLSFRRTYQDTKIIVLTDNYRSSQAILDTAQTIIEQADDRLVKREADLDKQLRAVNPPAKGMIQHVAFPTRDHQLSAVAQRVQLAWQQHTEQSIAVLARSHDSLRRLSSLLTKLHVPISYEQQNNVLEQEIVEQVCRLAACVTAIGRGDEAMVNYHLAGLLRHPMWHLKPTALWRLAVDNYPHAHWLDSLQTHADSQLQAIAQWLLWLAGETSRQPLPVMLEYLIGLRAGVHLTSPVRDYFLSLRAVDTSYLEALSASQLLTSLTTEFAADQTATLEDFVRFIDLNRELGRAVTDESWFVSGERAVQIMTVHKAKGLEFDSVFLVDAVDESWRPRHMGRKPPANLPLQPYGEQYDDYVRLLYVAATRAKSSLIVSSYYRDAQGKTMLPTPLISALATTLIDAETAEEPITLLEKSLLWPRLENDNERLLLQKRLDGYCLSATGLLQFLDVANGGPQSFFERQLLRLPDVQTDTMAYGTAMHSALQTAQQLVNGKAFTLAKVLKAYDTALAQQSIPLDELQRYQPHGRQVIEQLFGKLNFKLPKGAAAEVSLTPVELGDARLGGQLDHLFQTDDGLVISDYKTGTPLTSFTTRDQTKTIKAWRHRTQLLFYSLLAQQSGRYKPSSQLRARMLYVEAETPQALSLGIEPNTEELEALQRLIQAVWRHIQELNFPDVSAYAPSSAGIAAFANDLIEGKI